MFKTQLFPFYYLQTRISNIQSFGTFKAVNGIPKEFNEKGINFRGFRDF